MMERGSSYKEKYLTDDEIAELLADSLSDVPDDADSDSDSSIIGNRQKKLCILYRVTVTVTKVQTKVTMTMKH